MKSIIVLLALLVWKEVLCQVPKGKMTIVITETTPYCGGANPPEHILEKAREKRIPDGEKFYIIKGCRNYKGRTIVKAFVVSSSGKEFHNLKPGCYSIIDDFGYNKISTNNDLYDLECLKKLWEKPLFTFQVLKRKDSTYAFNIAEPCPYSHPCYKGQAALPM